MNTNNYIKVDGGIWFTQRTMSEILGIKSHTVNWHLKEIEKIDNSFEIKEIKVIRKEGERIITRNLKHYSLESLFDISMRCNRLASFNNIMKEIEKNCEVNLDFKVRPIKERNFQGILKESLEGILDFECQYRVDNYSVDFYFPKLNLCVEYDETHHKYTKDGDIFRERHIIELIGCNFLRVNEGEELQGLNQILKINMRQLTTV